MNKFLIGVVAVLGTLGLVAIIGLLTGVFVMLLWNWLMPDIFGLPDITYWQGWGLSVLTGLLFKSTSTSSD